MVCGHDDFSFAHHFDENIFVHILIGICDSVGWAFVCSHKPYDCRIDFFPDLEKTKSMGFHA
jgi:hypothetical protein